MNLTIKSKLIGGFTIILVLLISIAVFMTNKLSESNHRLLNIVDVFSKKVNLSNELMITVLEASRHEKNMLLEKDLVQKDYYKNRIYKVLETIDIKTNELQELVEGKGVPIRPTPYCRPASFWRTFVKKSYAIQQGTNR